MSPFHEFRGENGWSNRFLQIFSYRSPTDSLSENVERSQGPSPFFESLSPSAVLKQLTMLFGFCSRFFDWPARWLVRSSRLVCRLKKSSQAVDQAVHTASKGNRKLDWKGSPCLSSHFRFLFHADERIINSKTHPKLNEPMDERTFLPSTLVPRLQPASRGADTVLTGTDSYSGGRGGSRRNRIEKLTIFFCSPHSSLSR